MLKPRHVAPIALLGAFHFISVVTFCTATIMETSHARLVESLVAPIFIVSLLGWFVTGWLVLMAWTNLVFRMWTAIQAGPARTTPWKALLFHFIPFYNFYWVFPAWWGWTKDYNEFVSRRQIDGPRMPERLGLAVSIAMVANACTMGLVLTFAYCALLSVFCWKAVDRVNAIARSPEKASAPLR
jgi:hypothetical protein